MSMSCTCPSEVCQTVDNAAPDVLAIPQSMTIVPPAGELPDAFPADVQYAIITVAAHQSFRPRGSRDGIPSSVPGVPKAIVPGLVEIINRSEWARESGRWAVRTVNSGLLILRGIDRKTRPTNPSELPVQAEPLAVGSKEEARAISESRNTARLQVALVPREWSIVVENPRFGNEVNPLENLDRALRRRELVPNPLRDALEEIHGPEMNRLEELLPEGFKIHNGEDFLLDGDAYGRATDDESATGRVEIEAELPFDIRQPIAPQIAERLTEFSDELRDTAARLVVSETISLQDEHEAADALDGNQSTGTGDYLVVERGRILHRFPSVSGAAAFRDGYGGGCELAEVLHTEAATLGKAVAADEPA